MPKSKQKKPTVAKLTARKGATRKKTSNEIKKTGKITPKAKKGISATQKISDSRAKAFKRVQRKGKKPPSNRFGQM